ncbi:SLC13 family permease [Pelovirga terrestris]|uniref:SLC13 family permease n=1 Tax=Pelovirga terrestris TaxID=2771352 RepID=A0A8J6QPH3_9BACT|nr:SLC13 family permease [Pelovirga terrestris]MBD1400361.1 SLC13 family permease [Pelovirga terrestris]
MTYDQGLLFAISITTVVFFVWGRWRHDVVALGALLTCVFAGLVPTEVAFAGVGHPAVITVACVLILSAGLQSTGAVDALVQRIMPKTGGILLSLTSLVGLGALLSAFMNNVGAMALLMPIAVQVAKKHGLPAGKVLMPLAFGTILGGMMTLIGTPPNMIVSGFRADIGSGGFAMFSFLPVGGAVAGAGVLFLLLIGWRLVPLREEAGAAGFETGNYLTEARVSEKGKAVGKNLWEIEEALGDVDAQVVGLVRNELRITAPNPLRVVKADDILIIEADPDALSAALTALDLTLEEEVPLTVAEDGEEETPAATVDESRNIDHGEAKEVTDKQTDIQEFVVMPATALIGRTASSIRLRSQYGINLLAISRQGKRSIKRLRISPIHAGDVLLMQGNPSSLSGFASTFGCVPLAKRSISLPDKRHALLASGIMVLAIGAAALGLAPAAISFATGVLAFMLLRIVPARKVYESVDWSIIVLLGALIPVAGAMATTGAADLLARTLLENVAQGHPILALAMMLILTMTLSDFMNNAATAAVMCPLAISLAMELQANPDSFLMAVAIGASCAFLTPIGHQNNTLILGPGGFRFGDYWRLGLPMEILVIGVSLPVLLWVWPL